MVFFRNFGKLQTIADNCRKSLSFVAQPDVQPAAQPEMQPAVQRAERFPGWRLRSELVFQVFHSIYSAVFRPVAALVAAEGVECARPRAEAVADLAHDPRQFRTPDHVAHGR